MLSNITNQNITPIKEYCASYDKLRRSCSQGQIMNMILTANSNNKVAFINKNKSKVPTSILKNKIWPRNPSYPDKWITGYENLKELENDNPRNLATVMNQTWNHILANNSYMKKTPPLNWTKSIEGTNFIQRSNNWVNAKEKKIEHLRYNLTAREAQGWTFQPQTKRNSPHRRMKIRYIFK